LEGKIESFSEKITRQKLVLVTVHGLRLWATAAVHQDIKFDSMSDLLAKFEFANLPSFVIS
jgi:hypothetical protein